MTDEELIARLRSQIGDDVQHVYDHKALFRISADRIEALVKERDEAKRLMQARHREMLAADDLMRKHQRRAERLEAAIQWRITDLEKNGFSHIHAALQGTLKAVLNEARTTLTQEEQADKWKCPINYPGCTKNCGSYGCGN